MKNLIAISLMLCFFMAKAQTLRGVIVNRPNIKQGEYTISQKAATPKVFTYQFSKKKSEMKLVSKDISSIDTIMIDVQGFKLPQENKIISQSQLIFFKDFEKNIVKQNSIKQGNEESLKDKIPAFDWKLSNETKVVLNYNCKKATTINKYYGIEIPVTAWYCEDININDGPMIYSGLPGFIMEVEIGTFSVYTFEKIVFSKDVVNIEEPINTAKEITFKEYKF